MSGPAVPTGMRGVPAAACPPALFACALLTPTTRSRTLRRAAAFKMGKKKGKKREKWRQVRGEIPTPIAEGISAP